MKRTDELRKKAALCRQTASVPTNGSTSADRVLIRLAETLEHEAATIERLFTRDRPGVAG
ncbi:MAG: hypothetical protein JWL84_5210 [Rhodospirillales bacterium]|nr:hypothetical protein [Rhodospirillales bacterium]